MQHLAIIPDGNRRWATQNKLESFFGHKRGFETVRTAIKVCLNNKIKYLSLYTFSSENFKRSDLEKNYLFDLLAQGFKDNVQELIDQDIRVSFIGDRHLFPDKIKDVVTVIEEKTQHAQTLFLNLLFCYGARAEIVNAAKEIAKRVTCGALKIEDITEETFQNALWTGTMPDPDLIIRTGKVSRLSNFLLYQAAYSEFAFPDCFWPEITEQILESYIEKFKETKRNFGS